MSLNKVLIIGNLTRDPETRTTPTGQTVSSFGIATSRVWKDQQGQRQEKTEFHNVVAWGKLAELCGQYLSKGRRTYLEGHLQTRDWIGEDGVKRYRTEIILDNVIFLDRAPGASTLGGTTAPLSGALPTAPASVPAAAPGNDFPDDASQLPHPEEIKVENIPF